MPSTPGVLNFPAALDDVVALIVAGNKNATTLTAGVLVGDVTLTVASTTGFPTSGTISIDNEIISYTGTTSTTFTGCTRGVDGTSAATHSSGAAVYGFATALHHNIVASAIIAAETKIGSGSSTPTVGKYLRGSTTAGTSAWSALLAADINAAFASTTLTPGADVSVAGTIGALGSGASSVVILNLGGTLVAVGNSAFGILLNATMTPTAADAAYWIYCGGAVASVASTTYNSAFGIFVNTVSKTGTGTVSAAYGIFINTPTAGTTNTALAFAAPAGAIAQEAWTAPTLINSWTNNAFSYQTAKYMKDTQGMVHTRGMIVGGTAATTAFTLPTGYAHNAVEGFAETWYNAGTWTNHNTLINFTAVEPVPTVASGSMIGIVSVFDPR